MLSSTTAGRPPPPPRTASNSSIHSNSAAANASLSRSTTQDSHSRLPSRANSGAGIVGASFGIPSSPIFSSASLSRREPSPLPSSLRPSVPAFAFSNRSKAGPMQIDWDSPRSQAPPDSPFARAWAELQMQRSSSARGSDVDMDETATSIGTGRATAAQQEPTDQSRSKLGPKDGTATVTSQVGSDGGAGSDDREQGHYAKGKESWLSMSAAAPSAVTTSPRKALSLKSRGFRNQATPGNGRTPLLATGENSNGVVDSEEDAMRERV
ncbi:hypothetical protein DFJ73DRAFT_777366 [Zopfochytrium polystomum]|nr:hypothetical protein DFJ73DRAFT_777366 [Zopfochytrium polystomum]